MEGTELPDRDGVVELLIRRVRRLFYLGNARHCPLCGGTYRKFRRASMGRRRPDAKCPGCNSLERHRLTWLYLRERTELLSSRRRVRRRVLHIAPERALRARFEAVPDLEYLTADLEPGRGMVRMDITDIQYPAASFDLIYCSHVLEHVPDDRRAMRELHRVMAPGGTVLISVPIAATVTVEDPTIEDPDERLRLFGQRDHVRRYGPDVVERLEEAGFAVEVVDAGGVAGAEEQVRMGLTPGQPLYVCSRR